MEFRLGAEKTIQNFVEVCAPMTCEDYNAAGYIILQTVLVVSCFICGLYSAWMIYKSRNAMNVRQRAPLVATAQILALTLFLGIQVGLEFALRRGFLDNWWGNSDGQIYESETQVPMSRFFYKFIRLALRLSVGYFTWFRAIVIWSYWRRREKYNGLKGWLVSLMTNFKHMMLSMVLGHLIWTFFFFGTGGWYVESSVTAGTWYNPSYTNFYKIFNSTYSRVMETAIFVPVAWLARSFPDRLSIRNEMIVIFCLNIASNQALESRLLGKLHECTNIGLKTDFVITCMMLLILSLSLRWFCRPQEFQLPPPSNPSNLHEFLMVPWYRYQFRKFIKHRYGAQRLRHLNKLIMSEYQQYISESLNISEGFTFENYRLIKQSDIDNSFDTVHFGKVKNSEQTFPDYSNAPSLQVTDQSAVHNNNSAVQKSRYPTIVHDLSEATEIPKYTNHHSLTGGLHKDHTLSVDVDELPNYSANFQNEYYEYRRTKSFKTVQRMLEEDATVFYLGVDNK